MYDIRGLSELNRYQLLREIKLHSSLIHQNVVALYSAFQVCGGWLGGGGGLCVPGECVCVWGGRGSWGSACEGGGGGMDRGTRSARMQALLTRVPSASAAASHAHCTWH